MVNQFEQKLRCLFFHQMQVQKPKDMKKFTHTPHTLLSNKCKTSYLYNKPHLKR